MAMFLLRRLAALCLVVLATSFAVFGALYAAPGSPEQFLVQGRSVSPEVLASIRDQYHLDAPFLVRYVDWLGAVVRGDFGISLGTRQDVGQMLLDRLPTTLMLTAYAAVIIVLIGVVAGAVAGLRPGWLDNVLLLGSNVGFAVPTFFAAMLLMSVFGVGLGWFPVFGSGEGLPDRLWHLTLPAFALALPSMAVVARISRTAVIEERESEHAETARSRGVPEAVVIRRHVLRNSLLPVVTASGVQVAGLFAGAFVVEHAFSLDGIGELLVAAVQQKEFAVVQAVTLLLVVGFGLVNLLVDVLYAVIDPRVRVGGAS
ncbi:MAG TPA: ABC transporter permease [Nocardioides sp.]|nr:ABC transporter permease [Nocardioides sp.]